MDWSDPATVAIPHGVAAVIRALDGVSVPFSVRELARVASVSPTNARHIVDRLAEHGLVTVDNIGGARLVRLNRNHLAAEPMVAIATLRRRALDRLRAEVSNWSLAPIHVSLFGSAARGDGDTKSDLDVLVIRDEAAAGNEWDDQLARSGELIATFTGNWVSWFQIDLAQLARMTKKEEPIVSEWLRDALTLYGPSFPTVLRKSSERTTTKGRGRSRDRADRNRT